MLLDSGGSAKAPRPSRPLIKQFTDQPVKLVINTGG
jgi:hypothetical protein